MPSARQSRFGNPQCEAERLRVAARACAVAEEGLLQRQDGRAVCRRDRRGRLRDARAAVVEPGVCDAVVRAEAGAVAPHRRLSGLRRLANVSGNRFLAGDARQGPSPSGCRRSRTGRRSPMRRTG
ncbi:hypothetical protein BVI434_1170015 [Burkholderia vietnamiensis]|nr:hypothetical protein BVI434_1170015 [Burkholderia vietnamiensis]